MDMLNKPYRLMHWGISPSTLIETTLKSKDGNLNASRSTQVTSKLTMSTQMP